LTDRSAAVETGEALFESNRQFWEQRRPHRAVEALLRVQDATATEINEVP